MMKKLTHSQFVERSQLRHGNRYDYYQTVISGADKKLLIRCRVHGMFEQIATDHMKGSGCPDCAGVKRLTCDAFIDRANQKHNSKYTYNNIVYKNVTTKVKITCSTHGDFLQTPKDHMRGYGCPDCGGSKKVTTDQFIERAVSVHGNTYTYDKVQLCSMNNDVVINCHVHGEFDQRPADHLNGIGCPICGTQKQGGGYCETYFLQHPGVKDTPACLYLIIVDSHFCKVGITKKQYIKQRFPGMKFTVVCSVSLPLYKAYLTEQDILSKYQASRYKTRDLQKLRHTGWTECFPLSMSPTLQKEFERL